MERPRRIRVPEFYFHVTARGNNRQRIFRTDADKMDYLQRLAKVLPSFQIRLLVYCLMTNHLHLLVQDARGGGLPFALPKIQGGFAQAWNRRRRRSGHVWGERYYPEPVESDEPLIGGSLYMHTNPNEAGMVTDARAYRWSSVGAYTSGHSDI